MIAIGADVQSQRAVSSSLQPPASSLSLTEGSVVFVQMDQQTIADYPVGGAATTQTFRYVYASYIDEPVVRKGPTSTSTVHFYHRNHQYSVTAMTTSTGAIAERYAYSAYGQPTILNASGTVISATTLSNRYTYTGREWDATLGLHHFRARWMSPSAGRFLSRYPIRYKGTEWDLYEFVGARCFTDTDPFGKQAWTCRGYRVREENGKFQCRQGTSNGQLPIGSGCGGAGAIVDPVPDGIFVNACFTHDECYGTCGSSKAACDRAFLSDMKDRCDTVYEDDPLGNLFCHRWAHSHYNAVVLAVGEFYESGQDKYCDRKDCPRPCGCYYVPLIPGT
ncbi:MAG: RHS repeat domain-containing protein [Planctomycetota bacterium]|jgi:RHS repeat-associated protein